MMYPTRNQQTIAGPAVVRGFGYWSGRDVRVEFRPAEPDTGVVFIRDDLEGRPPIAATIENWAETALRTTLRRGSVGVEMIEHVMAALAGLKIDNCEVWVDEAEMPGCDGSSLPYVEALSTAGIVEQDPYERTGQREVLNFGHTIGHAIEACCGFALRHGECVGLGLLAACRLSHQLGILDEETVARVEKLLSRLGLPTRLTDPIDTERILDTLRMDKKVRGGVGRFVLLEGVGRPVVRSDVPEGLVREAYESLLR